MRVVLDTNILLSAFLTKGGAAQQLFVRSIAVHRVLVSEYILREACEKLSGKLKVPDALVAVFIGYVRTRATVPDLPEKEGHIDFEDRKDVPILQFLDAAGAHFFVTGDKKLLALKKYKKTFILSLREALELL